MGAVPVAPERLVLSSGGYRLTLSKHHIENLKKEHQYVEKPVKMLFSSK